MKHSAPASTSTAWAARADREAFWVIPVGRNKYRRVGSSYLADLVIDASKATGVRANSTRLRKTGITAIANGRTSDLLDAKEQANHAKADGTLHYVRRSEDECRRRIKAAQRDLYQEKNAYGQ